MGRSEEILIKSLAFGGDGVGRIGNRVCFVPYAVPGDLLRVRIVNERPTFLRGEIETIIEPSPDRRPPRCRHFGRCGGCQWQQVSLERQLREKEQILRDAIGRIAGLDAPVRPIVASPVEYAYRARARLRRDGSGHLGYYARSSREFVAIEECPILVPVLEQRIRDYRTGALGEVELQASPSGGVSDRTVPGTLQDEGYAFHQANPFVNPLLAREIAAAVDQFIPEGAALDLIDLFCGNGNLSLPLAPRARRLRGFDSAEESIREASEAVRRLGYDHVAYSRQEAGRALASLRTRAPDDRSGGERCVIADPPRAGLRPLIDDLAALAPRLFLYVSCNPPTLARDAKSLVQAGFTLEHLVPFDMFPQTFHLESLAVFTRPRD